MNKIIFAASGLIHPPFLAIWKLHKILQNPAKFQFIKISSLEILPDDLDTYSGLLIYFHQKSISDQAFQKLDEFVSKGGGLLGIHSATASFKQSDPYFNLIGGRSIDHGQIEPITITHNPNQDIFPPTPPFTIQDELYYHNLKEDITVHYSVEVSGESIPVVWTRLHGKGKVCYAMPGHKTSVFRNPIIQMILSTALDWVSNE